VAAWSDSDKDLDREVKGCARPARRARRIGSRILLIKGKLSGGVERSDKDLDREVKGAPD
jgi:hypothetical protein